MCNVCRFCSMFLICFLLSSDCENNRINSYNNGLMKDGDVYIRIKELPCVVISDDIELSDSFYNVINNINDWFYPTYAITGEIDSDYFDIISDVPNEYRHGLVLVSEGFIGTFNNWDSDIGFVDYGGISSLYWNERGEILFADIIINYDISYDSQTFEDVLTHEIGHACFGLAHDGDSIDLGSCMTSPPPYDCEIINQDVRLILDSIDF